MTIAINISKEPWKSNDVQSSTYVESSKMDVDMVKSLYLNLDGNAVSFIPNCPHLSSNILNPNAHAFLPYQMVNDNCFCFFMDFILEEKCTWFGIEI